MGCRQPRPECPSYPLDEFIYDIANLHAGHRFSRDEHRWGGRLAVICHEAFGYQNIPGYLENGIPVQYGYGAESIVMDIHENGLNKHKWVTEFLGAGDIDRIIIEWRSLLRRSFTCPIPRVGPLDGFQGIGCHVADLERYPVPYPDRIA